MSGGHFDFAQYRMEDIACEIEYLIKINDNTDNKASTRDGP